MPSSVKPNACSKSKALVEINGIHNRKKTRNATKPDRRGLLEHEVIIIEDSDSESTLKENQPSTSSVDHGQGGSKRKVAPESSAEANRSQGGLKRKDSSAKADHSQCRKRKVASNSGAEASKRQKASVRVVGGRIYDSENGSTCHQCRQKTVDVTATCKSGGNPKRLCKQKFCPKCLLNRYGEKVDNVIRLDVWPCPKCRGICNCSICMKKKGCSPTGILSHTAKATGFASVAEYLKESKAEDSSVKLKKSSLDGKPVENRKGKQCAESDPSRFIPKANEGKPEEELVNKQKRKKFQGKQNAVESVLNSKDSEARSQELKDTVDLKKKKRRKLVVNRDKSESQRSEKRALVEVRSAQLEGIAEPLPNSKALKPKTQDTSEDVILPIGEELSNVAGLELSQTSIGPALQLLEFCSAFMKLLDFKKGQAEAILREIVRGTMVRRSSQSLFVQLHVKLLSYILEDDGEQCQVTSSPSGKNSWMASCRKHLLERSSVSALTRENQDLFLQALESGADGYGSLELHRKLELLNILCDDCLSTSKFRDYLEIALANNEDRQKATKEEISAARKEVKAASQKRKDAEAKRLLAVEKGAPLSADKQAALLEEVRLDAQKVAAARMALLEVASKAKTQKCDAIRTEPVALVNDGRVFWRLKGVKDRSVIVIQDMGKLDSGIVRETWSSYTKDQEELLVKFVSMKRLRELRSQQHCRPSLETTPGRPASSDLLNSQS